MQSLWAQLEHAETRGMGRAFMRLCPVPWFVNAQNPLT